jgi:hypothetical protein
VKIVIFIIAMSITCTAIADEFQARLMAGRQALQSPAGKIYEHSLSSAIIRAIGECVPPDSPSQTGTFSFVGYVSPLGVISSIEVQPGTAASRCFADKFGKATLPVPPVAPRGFKAFPLTIDMEIIP